MSWEDQGRQEHGWFGSGTSPNGPANDSGDGSGSGAQGLDQRLDAVINGSVAAMPAGLRSGTEARLDTRTRARLNSLMTTWSGGGNMDRAEFAGRFFGRAAAAVSRFRDTIIFDERRTRGQACRTFACGRR